MADIFVSPTEPAIFKTAFQPSALPEQFGVDFFMGSPHGTIGIQRKTIDDLLFSVRDGRMATQSIKASKLKIKILLLEGLLLKTTDNFILTDAFHDITYSQLTKMLLTIQLNGYWLIRTEDEKETIAAVRSVYDWSQKTTHSTLGNRPGVERDPWGDKSEEMEAVYFLSGLPGIGKTTAATIYEHWGIPLTWTISYDDLMAIPRIGKHRAKKLMEFITGDLY